MIQSPGNAAFRALNDVLQLPGSTNLADLDISLASVVLDLKRVIEAGVAQQYRFHLNTALVLGVNQGTTDFYTLASWTNVFRGRQRITSGITIPESYEFYIVRYGVFMTAARLTSFIAYWDPATTGTEGGDSLWVSTSQLTGASTCIPNLQERQYPWYHGPRDQDTHTHRWFADVTGAATMNINVTMFVAPPGVLPRLG